MAPTVQCYLARVKLVGSRSLVLLSLVACQPAAPLPPPAPQERSVVSRPSTPTAAGPTIEAGPCQQDSDCAIVPDYAANLLAGQQCCHWSCSGRVATKAFAERFAAQREALHCDDQICPKNDCACESPTLEPVCREGSCVDRCNRSTCQSSNHPDPTCR